MTSNLFVRPAISLLRRLPIGVQVGIIGLSAILALASAHWGTTAVALVGGLQFLYLLLALGIGMRNAVAVLRKQLNAVCAGDLTQDIALEGRDELAALGGEAQRLSHQLSQVVARIRSEAQLVAMSGSEATLQARSLSQRTESQAASLQQTRAGLGTLLDTVHRNAEQVRAADARAAQVNDQTATGQAAVQASVESMQRIEQRAKQMGDIIAVIDSIAFQTNLLALNAAVEAARAGDAGRGFAVVAAEVRMLAQRSAQAAAEVKQLIRSSNDEVASGVQTIERSHASLAQAVEGIRDVAERLREFARSSDGQNASLQEIAQAVATLDDITQHNARMAEGSVHTADQLRARAGRLSDGVQDMRLRQGCADEAKALAERASTTRRASSATATFTSWSPTATTTSAPSAPTRARPASCARTRSPTATRRPSARTPGARRMPAVAGSSSRRRTRSPSASSTSSATSPRRSAAVGRCCAASTAAMAWAAPW
jgi:methyl-accepting chemotaxis protein